MAINATLEVANYKLKLLKCSDIHKEETKETSLRRKTVPSQTSDMGKNTVSVLVHSFVLPQRANSVNILIITPLRYSRSKF